MPLNSLRPRSSAAAIANTIVRRDANGKIVGVNLPAAFSYAAPAAWVPVDASGAALVFANVAAMYIQIGSLIVAIATLDYPATADVSGNAIGGFPVASNASLGAVTGLIQYTNAATVVRLRKGNGNLLADFRDAAGNTPTNATLSGKSFNFAAIYFT